MHIAGCGRKSWSGWWGVGSGSSGIFRLGSPSSDHNHPTSFKDNISTNGDGGWFPRSAGSSLHWPRCWDSVILSVFSIFCSSAFSSIKPLRHRFQIWWISFWYSYKNKIHQRAKITSSCERVQRRDQAWLTSMCGSSKPACNVDQMSAKPQRDALTTYPDDSSKLAWSNFRGFTVSFWFVDVN